MNSEIHMTRSFGDIYELLKGKFVLTDDNVYSLYPSLFGSAAHVCVTEHGEDFKTLENAGRVLAEMATARLDRKSALVAVGGGVVGDLGGFAAAVYMRGVEWINVPTTLLAQLDSSIGGKTGVDLKGYKNMVGAFHLPKKVRICTDFIKTLPKREILCGLGEGFKTALLDETAQAEWNALSEKKDAETDYYPFVSACARFKESVVNEDFKEGGKRKILNLGHTVGHALEYLDDHRLSHGEYVAVGLAAESGVGKALGKISGGTADFIRGEAEKLAPNFKRLISSYGGEKVAEAAQADKKNVGGKISLMLAENHRTSEVYLAKEELAKELDEWISNL
ncbi:MAG: 3-dehydroquinate synthase [Clostridia bacterium]|nr:3-dehydroquinate synthase [Clostridia bacterium]